LIICEENLSRVIITTGDNDHPEASLGQSEGPRVNRPVSPPIPEPD